MARSRNLKPGFFRNETLAELHPLARILFEGLWCYADREGRLEDRPKRIKADILPYDDCDVDAFLWDLHNKGFILRYEVDGRRYIQVINFKKHQNPHVKEPPSEIPAPEMHHTSTVQDPEKNRIDPADSLNLDPDSINHNPDIYDDDNNARAREEKPNFVTTYENEFGRLISPMEYEKLKAYVDEGMDDEVVSEAIRKTREQGKTSVKYALTILNRWRDQGVINMAGVVRADKEFEKRKKEEKPYAREPTKSSDPLAYKKNSYFRRATGRSGPDL